MEDYTLLSFKDIKKLISRQIKTERRQLEPERYISKPKPRRKPYTPDECQHILTRSDFGWAMTQKDIFYGYQKEFTITKLQKQDLNMRKGDEIESIFGKIFFDFFLYVLKDIIINNITLKIPTIGAFADIHMRCVDKEEFAAGRQKGKYQDIDFLASNFKTYRPTVYRYSSQDSTKIWTTDIILDKQLQKELSDQINNGKVYYETTPKSINDYLEEFQYLYPSIKISLLKSIISYGWRQVSSNCKYYRDMYFSDEVNSIYIGNVETFSGNKPEVFYRRKLRKRLVRLFKTKNIKWDGYYYFCITRKEYNYYYRPTIKNKRKMRMSTCRAHTTKYFFFDYDKVLFKHPDIAFVYYSHSGQMVRTKAPQDFGDYRYIRTYLPIQNVELYMYKGSNTLESISTKKHKYKILWAKKRR